MASDGLDARRHEGSVAVLTAASRGIGLATAQRLVREGARVVITGRKPQALALAVESLGSEDHAVGVAGHAADGDHQDQTLDTALRHFGRIDALVNNAGINPAYGPLLDSDIDVGRTVLEVNVLAAFAWTQKAVRAGLGTGPGGGGGRQRRVRRRPRLVWREQGGADPPHHRTG